MPANTVYVGRPTQWGNPYKTGNRAADVRMYRIWLAFRALLELEDLRGKNLACWCPLTEPCHADVLIEIVRGYDG